MGSSRRDSSVKNLALDKVPSVSARIMTKNCELTQLEKFQQNMDMLTKTTLEVVDQFQRITGDLDVIAQHIEKQKNQREEINVMADLLDEKLQVLFASDVPATEQAHNFGNAGDDLQ